jgi:hypothetical protein
MLAAFMLGLAPLVLVAIAVSSVRHALLGQVQCNGPGLGCAMGGLERTDPWPHHAPHPLAIRPDAFAHDRARVAGRTCLGHALHVRGMLFRRTPRRRAYPCIESECIDRLLCHAIVQSAGRTRALTVRIAANAHSPLSREHQTLLGRNRLKTKKRLGGQDKARFARVPSGLNQLEKIRCMD